MVETKDNGSVQVTVPLHKNQNILDYISGRFFNGFRLEVRKDKLVLLSSDSSIITLLVRGRVIKEEVDDVEIDIMTLLAKRSFIKKAARELRWHYEDDFTDLNEALSAITSFSDPEVKQRLSEGYAAYSDMPVLFCRGTEAVVTTDAGMLGGIVETCTEHHTFFGNYYAIAMSIMLPTSKGCCVGKYTHRVYDFEAAKMPIEKLGIRPIKPEDKAYLTERGKAFRDFTKAPTPATYHGTLAVPDWTRERIFNADGRVMVDSANFAQVDSDLYYDVMREFSIDEDSVGGLVKDGDLWRCYNRVHGFSMRLKRWGWLNVEGLKPVKWRDDAFNQLVLSPQHKNAVLHLVKHYSNSFGDFIDGKSGGLIFLLEGPTGTGKTLTSEAVAETLHRPLYSVSVGELGTTPSQLEERLRAILDLAYQWNAVLLLDEADIFMEARDTNNIERNAMVSIFLRLLEYYSGVMFLTTNRVKTFDPAFYSRISMAIEYPKLNATDRTSVWYNVLSAADVDIRDINVDELADFAVNGRNIKTAVRIAQTMAAGNNRSVTQSDLVDVLRLTADFNHKVDI